MSEICKYESYLVKNFPNASLKNRGVLLSDLRSFYWSMKNRNVQIIALDGRNTTNDSLNRCEKLIENEDLAVKNLGEINKFDKIFSQAYEMLRILLDLLKQKKVELDSVDKAIGELDKAKINFSSKKTGTELDKLFEDTTELIIRSYGERYALLKKDKYDITRAMIEFKLKIQDFVRVLDEVYYWVHDYYSEQSTANKIYTRIFQN